jgi:hypothetical protein
VPHDRRALSDQLRAHLTRQRYNPVVIHNQCGVPSTFLIAVCLLPSFLSLIMKRIVSEVLSEEGR